MKFSRMSTDGAFDAMCELTPYIGNIVGDKAVVGSIGKIVKPDREINKYGYAALVMERILECLPLLLETHRPDMYGILSVMSEKEDSQRLTVNEIAAQSFVDTMRLAKEVLHDEEFISFFKSSAQQAQSEQSAPSAASPAAE